ncbi:MAG TPA: TMEM175 family protein [Caulobacteraceae bacterium]|jgi:hypothetical protein
MDEFSRHHGFQRLLFFSDAVFAIAITLLILDVRLPPGATALDLREAWPQIMGFVISFYVIGRFWLAHHSLFEGVGGYDNRVLRSNLLFLAAVVFLPFPTMVLAELKASAATVAFYGLSLAVVGLLMVYLTWHARKPALLLPGQTVGGTVRRFVNMGGVTLVFLLTAAVGQVWPERALLVLLLLFPVGPLADALGRRLAEKTDNRAGHPARSPVERDAGVTTP